MHNAPIDKAIDAVGGLTELARRLKVDPQVVVNWRKRGIPVDRVPEVSAATIPRDHQTDLPIEGEAPKVSRHELRPDKPLLFPPESAERAAA